MLTQEVSIDIREGGREKHRSIIASHKCSDWGSNLQTSVVGDNALTK